MLPDKIAFVDIETTGSRSFYDRVIEIGIIKVEDKSVTKTFHSLINPQTYVPKEIELLTGITPQDLENAPTFRQIKDDILEIITDCIFVAHNVRFDYSFLKNEFKRENFTFSMKYFCTVRLSRLLYPAYRHHNLDALIERFGLPCENRHRALDDARAIFYFYQKILSEFTTKKLVECIAKSMKKPSLPLRLQQAELEKLPEKPGVYIFYGENGMPLYVGKSKNIKNRVLSHFSSDIRSSVEMKISQQIESIETIPTAGELGALFLECRLIKKLLPLYNRKSRIKRELVAVKSKRNEKGYQTCYLEPVTAINPENFDTYLGFFKSRKQAKSYLSELAKKYSLCEKLLGLEHTKSACFAYRLNRCKGACIGIEKPVIYNMKCINAFSATKIASWPFKEPVIIEEEELEGRREYFIIDKWCYLGTVVIDREENKKSTLTQTPVFDLDMYRILLQYLKNPTNMTKIRSLSAEWKISLHE